MFIKKLNRQMDNKLVLLVGITAGIAAAVYLLYQELQKQRMQIREQNMQIRALIQQSKRVEGLIYTYNIDQLENSNGGNRRGSSERLLSTSAFPIEENARDMIYAWEEEQHTNRNNRNNFKRKVNNNEEEDETSNSHSDSTDDSSNSNSENGGEIMVDTSGQAVPRRYVYPMSNGPTTTFLSQRIPLPPQSLPQSLPFNISDMMNEMFSIQRGQRSQIYNNQRPINNDVRVNTPRDSTHIPTRTTSGNSTQAQVLTQDIKTFDVEEDSNSHGNDDESDDEYNDEQVQHHNNQVHNEGDHNVEDHIEVHNEGDRNEEEDRNDDEENVYGNEEESKKPRYYKDTPTNRKLGRVGHIIPNKR